MYIPVHLHVLTVSKLCVAKFQHQCCELQVGNKSHILQNYKWAQKNSRDQVHAIPGMMSTPFALQELSLTTNYTIPLPYSVTHSAKKLRSVFFFWFGIRTLPAQFLYSFPKQTWGKGSIVNYIYYTHQQQTNCIVHPKTNTDQLKAQPKANLLKNLG